MGALFGEYSTGSNVHVIGRARFHNDLELFLLGVFLLAQTEVLRHESEIFTGCVRGDSFY